MAAALDAVPADRLTYLVTEFGKPFTANGLGNWFRRKCDAAGLPQCSAHGPRKAMSRRLAEAGATVLEGRAITGHKTDREFAKYAESAGRTALGAGRCARWWRTTPSPKFANPEKPQAGEVLMNDGGGQG